MTTHPDNSELDVVAYAESVGYPNYMYLPDVTKIVLGKAFKHYQQTLQTEIDRALDEAISKIDEEHEKAERRGKEMTSRNRVKWARQNETLGESHARNQGFKSGILTAKARIAALKANLGKGESV